MIREATIEDLKAIVYLGERFHQEAHREGETMYDHIEAYKGLYELHKTGILLVYDIDGEIVGTIGGTLFTLWYDKVNLIGEERFWYVDRPYRNGLVGVKLLRAFEKEVKRQGATRCIMISEAAMGNNDIVHNMYERMGYTTFETGFIKSI